MAGYLGNFIQGYPSIAAPLHQLKRKETKFHWGKKEHKASCRIQDILSDDQTMAYFDIDKQSILRAEASFSEGLSTALLQNTDRGIRPLHFISRMMTEVEKKYSPTERDALAIK